MVEWHLLHMLLSMSDTARIILPSTAAASRQVRRQASWWTHVHTVRMHIATWRWPRRPLILLCLTRRQVRRQASWWTQSQCAGVGAVAFVADVRWQLMWH